MKLDRLYIGVLCVFLSFVGLLPLTAQDVEEPNEKAARYHSLLLKKPGNAMVFSRFVDAWLDTGSKAGLTGWLESEAKKGTDANWRVLGALHQYLGEDEEALKALNEAVKLNGESADLRLSRAKMQARLLAFEAALVDLEVAMKDEKAAIEASKLKGMYLARSGQVEEAVKAWKEVIAAYPKDEDLREDLIEVEVMEGLYKDAIEASTGLVEMTKDPYKKTLRRLRLGDIQILAGDREAGLKTYEEIMSATGEGTWLEREVLAQVERVFLKEDDIKGLRDFYQKLREEHPRRVSIRKVLARQMALNDEMKEAIELFREVLKITPGDLGNREEFVAFLESNEKWKEAKEELVALLEQRKDDALLWERLSRIEAKLNDQEGLKVALAKVAELKKGTPEGLLATAALYEQSKLLAEAEAMLREGRTSFADSVEVAEGLASFLIQNKKEEEALAIWNEMAKGADREGLLRVARSLSSHGKGEVAFGILGKRVGEFENDPLILTQYCKLASSVEEASKAIPQGLALVNQATTPTELEGAVQTALRLIARAEKKEEIQTSLAGQADLGVTGQCLLSAIYADQGDSMKASETLTKAAAREDGSLARFYRVRFEEDRGNLEEAIVILRGIIETPEGRKTVHLRRLVDLLERSGGYEKALAAVDDWKRIAPGDHSAWKRRAKLLQANGQPDDAVVELRRMIGKFGADEERRAELAAALIEAAEYMPAQRIYEQLYSESEKLETKLKWAGEMAQLAEREGRLEELLEDFDRRKRSNPRSVAPLLAIAEVHRVLDNYEERRSALLEASRRRPEDTQLLARIAEVEERAGEFDRAVGILRDAVKRDKTPESKKRLASLLLKNGEVQSGLDILGDIPEMLSDPRGLEGVVQSLIRAQETEQAMVFLQKHLGRHEGDWRLKYLEAMTLKLAGDHEEAISAFTLLLQGGNEIAGLKPLVSAKNTSPGMGWWNNLFEVNGWSELTPYQQFLTGQPHQQMNAALRTPISLPGTPRELQLLSLIQGSAILSELPEDQQAEARESLVLPGIHDVELLAMIMTGDQQKGQMILAEKVKEDPDNKGLFAMNMIYKGNSGGITLEDFKKARELLLEEHPEVFALVAFPAMQSPEVSSEMVVEALTAAVESLPRNEIDQIMQMLSFYAFSPYGEQASGGKDMKPIKNFMAERALGTLEKPKNWGWMPSVVSFLLSEGQNETALNLINRFCEWQESEKGGVAPGGVMGMIFFGNSSQSRRYLQPPSFPPTSLKGVPGQLLSLFPTKAQKSGTEKTNDAQAKLLAQLQLQEDGLLKEKPLTDFGEEAAQIKNPALRALAFISIGKEDEAKELIEAMLLSREESSLLFAAGYLHDRDDPRAYDALLKLRMLPLSRDSRKMVDGHLAVVGSQLIEQKELKIEAETAKRAALRLRRVLGVDEREQLGEILVKLGLKDEAERLAAAPKPAGSSQGLNLIRPSSRQQEDRIGKLKKEGNIDGAAREAAKQFRSLVSRQGNEWELEELAEKLTSRELKEETLKKLDPGETESTKRILGFAKAQELFGSKKKAKQLFEKVLAKDADHVEALMGVVRSIPLKELDHDRLVIRKNGKIDVEASGQIFAALWESSDSGRNLDHYLGLCKLTEQFLETLPPSGEVGRNLSWVPYHILSFAGDTYVGNESLPALVDIGSGYNQSEEADKKAIQKRNDAAEAVFVAMTKHPQIAEQGFMLLESARAGLGLSDDDLIKLARVAMETMFEKKEGSNRFGQNNLWSKYYKNGSTSSGQLNNAKNPMGWLMEHAAKTDLEVITPELLEKIRKTNPKLVELLEEARALAEAEPAEAEKIYAAWKEDLPASKRLQVIAFARQLLFFSPKAGPWADDLEGLFFDSADSSHQYGYGSGNGDWANLVGDWGAWRLRTSGPEKYEAFLTRVFEGGYGPSDKWEVLAQLGEDGLPQKYEQAGWAFQDVSRKLLSHPELVKTTLLFVERHSLDQFVYNLDSSVEKAWAPRYTHPEAALKTILENQLLTSEVEVSLEHFLIVAERVPLIRLNGNSGVKKKLSQLILKEKELHPVLQKVAAASLLDQAGGQKLMKPFLEENLDFVKKLADRHPDRSFEILRKWFPRMDEAEVSAPLRELFKAFSKEANAERQARLKKWLENGVPGIGSRDDDEFWAELVPAISADEELGHKVVIRALKDIKAAKSTGRSSRNGVYLRQEDQWMESLLRLLQRGESQLNLPQQVRLLDTIYESDIGETLLEPSGSSPYSRDWLWDQFIGTDKKPKESQNPSTIVTWLEGLNPRQEAKLAVFWSKSALNAKEFKKLEKHEKHFAEHAPILSCLVKMVRNHEAWKSKKDAERLEKARLNYLTILQSDELSPAFKVEFLSRMSDRAPALHSDKRIFEEISKIMASYCASERNIAGSSLNRTLTKLSELDFPELVEVGGAVVDLADQHLLSPKVAQSRRGGKVPELVVSLIKLALKTDRVKIASKLLRKDYASFRGNLAIMLSFAEAGEFGSVKKLLPANAGSYSTAELGVYDKDFHEFAGTLLKEIQEGSRYHLELVLASLRDPKKGKGTPHSVLRGARLQELAEEFVERGAVLKGDARLQALGILATDRQSSSPVEAELREIFARTSIGDGFVFEQNSSSVERADGFEIFKRVAHIEMQAKNFAPIIEKLTEFQEVIASGGNNTWRLGYQSNQVFGFIGRELVRAAVRSSEDAEATLAAACDFFDLAIKIPNRSAPSNSLDGASLIVHSLVGKSEDWKAHLENHPDKERFEKVRKDRDRDAIFEDLVSGAWRSEEMAPFRAKVLRALFDSPYYKERELRHVHDFYGLSKTRLFTAQEVVDAAKILPGDHPLKIDAMFHAAGLTAYRLKGKTNQEKFEAYQVALEFARSGGEDKLANLILAHRCELFYRNKEKAKAKRDAPLIEVDKLPKRDQDWVKKALPKWLKG